MIFVRVSDRFLLERNRPKLVISCASNAFLTALMSIISLFYAVWEHLFIISKRDLESVNICRRIRRSKKFSRSFFMAYNASKASENAYTSPARTDLKTLRVFLLE